MNFKTVNIYNAENPFGTAEGQLIASQSESFFARKRREGIIVTGVKDGTSAPTPGSYTVSVVNEMSGQNGFIIYPVKAVVSCSQDAVIGVGIKTGVADDTQILYMAYAKAGQPLTIDFDGDIFIKYNASVNGAIDLRAKPISVAGTIHGCVYGLRVAENA